jgi:signal transduction histidine kinase
VLEDTKSLNKAAISLLDLASLAADDVRLPLNPVRIDEVLWVIRERLIQAQPGFKVDLNIGNPDDEQYLTVAGDEHLLGIAFANLMENGCKYSPDHTVRVTVSHDGASIVLQFEDNGPGIKSEELTQIFEPFYRGTNSKIAVGYGIGLSLVQRILLHHHSTISVQSAPDRGTRFLIHFPIDSDPQTDIYS